MMNLNSLLNGNSSAVDQPKEGGQEAIVSMYTRNRTSWDADGYSLPVYTPSTKPHIHQQINYDFDKHVSTQKLPRHSYSDSRSSLFSLSSTTDSSSHSRISSISTTEGFQPQKNLAQSVCDSPSPKTAAQFFCEAANDPMRNSIDHMNPGTSSPCGTRKDRENITEQARRTSERGINFNRSLMTPIKEKEIPSLKNSGEIGRPTSPSDAMLIKRQQTTLCLRLAKEDSESRLANFPRLENNNLGKTAKGPGRSLPHFMSHKRAYSAPNLHPQAHQIKLANTNTLVSSIELTPPNSIHPDHPSPKFLSLYQTPETPPQVPSEIEAKTIRCMYVANCDTGSQLRKAISHIFGRNKICTRQIPSRVWVHYCRKHYQRSRYRNPKEYAKLQCDLVQQQIRRVHEWSQFNAAAGKGSVVQDWTISVRKREQKRLDDIQNSRKRKTTSSDREEEEEEDFSVEVNCKNSGSAIPATAVPEWLLEHCRKGYNTQEILEIFNRLHQEILNDTISTFPDIEILPNISIEQHETWSPNGCIKRPPSTYHKRAKSLTAALSSIYESREDRRSNQLYNSNLESFNTNIPLTRRLSSSVIMNTPDSTYQPYNSNSESFNTNITPSRRFSSSVIVNTPDSTYQPFGRYLASDRTRSSSAVALHSRIEGNKIPEDFENLALCKPSLQSTFIPQQNINQDTNCQNDLGNLYQNISQQSFHQRSLSDFGSLSNLPPSEALMYLSWTPM